MTPTGRNECYSMLKTGYDHKGPAAVRYPRANVKDEYSMTRNEAIEIGKADVVCKGKDIAILAFGPLVENCRKATDELGATLVNMRFVKPLDEELLKNLAKTHKYFVTVEDNAISGGAGSAVNEFFAREKIKVFIKGLGLPDKFLDHGTREEILIEAGLDEEGILKSIKSFIK